MSATSTVIKGSSSDNPNPFVANGLAYTDGFSWHATGGEVPFTISGFNVLRLQTQLENENYGVGVRTAMAEKCLKTDYLN